METGLIVRHVRPMQRGIGLVCALFQKHLRLPSRVAAHILIIPITGPDGDQDGHRVCAGDSQATAAILDLAILRPHVR